MSAGLEAASASRLSETSSMRRYILQPGSVGNNGEATMTGASRDGARRRHPARLQPTGFCSRKFGRPEDRIGDVHEGPRRQHSYVESQLHANFHDFRSGEAET